MPRFQRRRVFRRRRRVPWYNRKYSTAQIARAAWRSAKYIRGLVNSERFHKDAALTLGNNQSIVHNLVNIAQGDHLSGRTGNSILVKGLSINGNMYINASQTTNTRIMLALVRDKQQLADTVPQVDDIFSSAADPHALLNASSLGRFSIIWRKQYTLDSNAAGNNAFTIRKYDKFNFHVRYNATAAGDIQKNGLYLVMMTSESSLYPTIALNTRLSYHDN